ncbi:MAG TPA: hypothetical protein VF304_09305 [Casimicrobiaceae bacterium]
MNPPVPPDAPAAIGWVDEPRGDVVGSRIHVAGWALAASWIRAVEVRLFGKAHGTCYGLPREDVAAVRPGYPDNPYSGFAATLDLSQDFAPPGALRRTLSVVAISGDGLETEIGRRSLIEPSVHERWRFVQHDGSAPFHLIPALSGIAIGSTNGLEKRYAAYTSSTTRIGMRVPILYLRTTRGAEGDYDFDPDFDVQQRNGARAIADDALSQLLGHSAALGLPVLVTLNGGIWADASGTCPQFDAIDHLEEDVANCQWNERDAVMPDDFLSHLPGSQHAPELARALTLNVYARRVRDYKRRNLQEAARHLVLFMHAHDELFIGVNLDPDVYVNPFFAEAQWYDYNPQTLEQFRHWLAGTGPYAGDCDDGVPDLSRYRRTLPLSLDAVGKLARQCFSRWQEVDPPRTFSRDPANAYWHDPWVREWEHFRRHLVALHYDELAQWLVEAGIPSARIWSSQGLMAPAHDAMPLALSITSPVKNHDSGGVCIEGSKPRDGHLGAIVYGAAATNEMPMENGRSLYPTLAAIDPGFAIVEFNTADLREPARHPTYADAYRALRDLWNAGARFVSPMAWNGSNGAQATSADYVTFTAWRNTPLEEAACDFLLERSGLPLGSKLWTFGAGSYASDDGWAARNGSMRTQPGRLEAIADAKGLVMLVSPPELAVSSEAIDAFVVGVRGDVPVETIEVAACAADDPDAWQVVARAKGDDAVRRDAGYVVHACTLQNAFVVDRLRLTLRVAPNDTVTLARVAVLRRAQSAV